MLPALNAATPSIALPMGLPHEFDPHFCAHLMRLTRVYVDATLTPGASVELARDSAAHLAKVLRARSGDEIVLFNGDGREFTGAIDTVRGSRVSASIGAARTVDRESPFRLTLVQCVPRGDRMDFIVQKATELGIARIVPVLSQRSVVRLDATQATAKQEHWHAVAVNACEQCGRNRLPVIETPQPLLNHLGATASLPASPGALRLVLEPESAPLEMPSANGNGLTSGDSTRPSSRIAASDHVAAEGRSAAPHRGPTEGSNAASDRVATDGHTAAIECADIAIGPEGGFTADELEAFQLAGFSPTRLGPRVLRTETAAIAAIVVLQSRFGDLSAASYGPSRSGDV
jgi:16S rRNA (uracil1498-N3)-methyltransferase